MATLKEIAKKANVSFQAVSTALNGCGNSRISPAKKAEIERIAKEMNYRPNRIASGLRQNRTQTLGIVFLNSVDAYSTEMLNGIQHKLNDTGYTALYSFPTGGDPLIRQIDRFLERRVDGLIVFNSPKEVLTGGKAYGIPTVCMPLSNFGQSFEECPCDTMYQDLGTAVGNGVKYLHGLGHRTFGYIGGCHDMRFQRFRETVEACGLSVREDWIYADWGTSQTGFNGVRKILEAGKRPTALVCFNDTVAIAALAALQSNGYRVPEDFSVIGCDDLRSSAFCWPRLTTFDSRIEDVGMILVDMMIERLATPDMPLRHLSMIPKLTVRESCAPPRNQG